VSPSPMLSRSSQARVSACTRAGSASSRSRSGRSQAGSVREVIFVPMRSALLGAAAQVLAAEACAQQGTGIIGDAAQPGGVGLLALRGGGRLGLRLRRASVICAVRAFARSRIQCTLHRLALRFVGGLLAGPCLGVGGIGGRRVGAVRGAIGGLRWRGFGGRLVRNIPGVIIGRALALLAPLAVIGTGIAGLRTVGPGVTTAATAL